MEHALEQFYNDFALLANPENAFKMEAYMKSRFKFLGVKSPRRKAELSKWIKDHKELVDVDFRSIAVLLFSKPYREFHYCGMELLTKYHRTLNKDDVTLIEQLLLMHSWWDTVDLLASYCVGSLFRDVRLRDTVTSKWMATNNIWLQRSCVISQLKYKEDTDLDYLFQLIDRLCDSDEFFIQKANGWALRQGSKYYPIEIRSYVDSKSNWPSVTYREATKYL